MKFQGVIKIARRLVLAALAVLLVALVLLLLFFDALGQRMLSVNSDAIKGDLEVGKFRLTTSGVSLDDVSWSYLDPEPIFEAERIDLDLDFGKLFEGETLGALEGGTIIGPGVEIVVDENGVVNLTRLFRGETDTEGLDLSKLRGKFTFRDGYILYKDRRDTSFIYKLDDWKGEVEFPDGEHVRLSTSMHEAGDQTSTLSLSGEVDLDEPDLALDVDLDQLGLLSFAGYPGFGPGRTLVDGELSASLRLQGKAETWGQLPANLFMVGDVSLKDGGFRAPWMPDALKNMEGTLNLLGDTVGTRAFSGEFAGIGFQARGEAELGPQGDLEAELFTERFNLDQIRPLTDGQLPAEAKGELELRIHVEGQLSDPTVTGTLKGYDLAFQDKTAEFARADFLANENLLHISDLQARTMAGPVEGEGWVFLSGEPRLLFELRGTNTRPGALFPDLAQDGSFHVKLLGSPESPVVYGGGSLRGLGQWGRGLSRADGRFLYTGEDVILYDGSASANGSSVKIPLAALDLDQRQLDAFVSATGFQLSDLPGLSGIDGSVTGSVLVNADLSREEPQITAQGRLRRGDVSASGFQARGVSGDFFFDGHQVVVPGMSGTFEGGPFQASGVYDTRNQGIQIAARSEGADLSRFGLPGRSATVSGTVTGRLDGDLGLYGHASTSSGSAALSGYRTAAGQLRGVAWLKGVDPRYGENVSATVVAHGRPDNLDLEYNGQLEAAAFADLGPVDIFGAANLSNGLLRLRPTLLTAQAAVEDAVVYPVTTYSGQAVPLFGPLLAGPLDKVVIEEPPYPKTRSLTLRGQADLGRRTMNVGFQLRAAGLEEFANLPLSSDPEDESAPTLNQRLPYTVLSAYGSAEGRLRGSLAAPVLETALELPWLLLENRSLERESLSANGSFVLNRRSLQVPGLVISETPNDPRLSGGPGALPARLGNGLMRLAGKLKSSGEFDIRVATNDFAASVLAFFADGRAGPYLPYGRIATENLHLWGTLANPAVSGSIALTEGGFLIGHEVLPVEQASLDFSSQGKAARIEQFILKAPGLDVSGYGSLSGEGRLDGQVTARDIELSEFHRLGGAVRGLEGRADVIARLKGSYPGNPALEIGVLGRELTWDPQAIGGLEGVVPIEQFVLGRFQGEELEEGMTVAGSERGLFLELPDEGFMLQVEEGPLLTAEGAVALQAGTSAQTLLEYLSSPQGPDFGRAGEPFRVEARGWTFRQVSRLLGRAAPPYDFLASGSLELEGQWWRDHFRDSASTLPRYVLKVDELRFEGGAESERSGFELGQPTSLVYQREGEAGYLTLQDMILEFFRRRPVETVAAQPAEEEDPQEAPPQENVSQRGSLVADARLAVTQLPSAEPRSSLQFAGVDIPLQNLAFLFPNAFRIDGLVETLELNLDGVLPSPGLSLTAKVSQLALGPLENMNLTGEVRGSDTKSGYLVTLTSKEGKPVTVTFGGNDSADHRVTAQGETLIRWDQDKTANPERLHLVGRNLQIDLQSPVDLSATVIDRNLEVLADLVPGEERTSGTFEADLNVDGTLKRPEFEGKATLANGSFNSTRYGNFSKLQVDATVERLQREQAEDSQVLQQATSGLITRFSLNKLEGFLEGQPFFSGGKAELAGISPTFLNLFLVGEALPIKLPGLFTGRVDMDFELKGQPRQTEEGVELEPLLRGIVSIPQGDFTLPLSMVNSGGGDVQGVTGGGLPAQVDLDLSLGQEFFVKAYNSEVRAVGDLRVVTENNSPRVYGQVALSRGLIRIPFYDASFRVRQGLAIFDGPLMPRLQAVEAVADLGGYRITAQADGRLPDINLQLLSDPPLPQSELNRLVVLGGLPGSGLSDASDPTQSSSSLGVLSGQGVSFLSGILTNRLTEQLGRLFFLSEVSFDYVPPAQYVIKLAKALDAEDRLLFTLTRVIRDNALNENLFGVEWRFTRSFLTRVAFDEFGQARFWFQSISRF